METNAAITNIGVSDVLINIAFAILPVVILASVVIILIRLSKNKSEQRIEKLEQRVTALEKEGKK